MVGEEEGEDVEDVEKSQYNVKVPSSVESGDL